MITTLVTFRLPAPISPEQARAIFESTAPRYLQLPGLVRKYYVLSEDGASAGGIYLWRTRADAEALYTEAWKDFVRDKYGSEPAITYLHGPGVVDNPSGRILTDGGTAARRWPAAAARYGRSTTFRPGRRSDAAT